MSNIKILSIFLLIFLLGSTISSSSLNSARSAETYSLVNGSKIVENPHNNVFYLNQEGANKYLTPIKAEGIVGDFKILIDEGHGQYYSGDRLATFKEMINAYFGTYVINDDNFTDSDFNNIDLVVIPNPEGNFTDEEVELLRSYVENGGKLLIMATWSTYFEPYSYNELTNKYGIFWNDTSVVDETDNFGGSYAQYQIKVHTWDSNSIVNEMGVATYTSEVYFDGTALTLGPYNSNVVEEGPYFVGIPDSDTYILLPNGTSLVPGTNYSKPFGFHIAVKLVNGGKIFASGSTREIADPYIGYGDTYNFVKLVIAWLLDLSPENVLLPEIKNLVSPESIRPQETNWVNFTIENTVPINRSDMRLKIYVPYFVEIYDNVTFESSMRSESLRVVPGSFIELGTIYENEKINVSVPIKGILGVEVSGVISLYLYTGDTLVSSASASIYSAPTMEVIAEFIPFYINVSKTNTSILYVNLTSEVSYEIKGVEISLKDIPEGISVNVTSYKIDTVNPGDKISKAFEVEISGIGVYELPVVIKDLNGSTIVRRPFLLGITQKLIVFDEGHNQYIRFASPYMQGLINLLKEYGPVLINKGEFSPAILDPTVTNLIVIPVPQPYTASPSDTSTPIFTEDEIANLQSFVDNGGSLLLMGNWYMYFWPDNPNSYNELTEPYGIHWIDGDIYDRVNNLGAPYQVVLKNFANNSVAKYMSSGVSEVYFSGTGLLQVTPTKSVTVYPILLGNKESFVTEGAIDANNVTVGLDSILVMAVETSTGGRIVASGSSYVFSDAYYFDQDIDFIKNIISWLSKINKLSLDISPIPAQLPVGEPIKVKVRVKNAGVQKLTNVAIDIPSLPAGKVELYNSSRIDIGDLEPGEYVDLTLVFKGKEEGSYLIQINALVDNKVRETVTIILNFVVTKQGINWGLVGVGIIGLIIIVILALKFLVPTIRKRGE